ncbi:carbohydrate kinase family protein [Paracraurococcus lichenis]|uniref:Carbohydrate kinase n=1 Tax=Paracraurococcus lichenis TaxID=3064888 RepID=A0ABT9DW93_9PROT|nr:carbohydrate kinase [Paracraurococcus sp. LOR1-02]MDO9708164.1 carbohydrate kinase [Paracraurococcus sp. LOR1-02]
MILVCGEALIDLFVQGPAAGATLPALAAAGGSPFNLAVGLARLGVPAGFLGGLSQDGFGDFLAGRLAAEGVDTALARRSPKPTPLVVVSPGPDGHPHYTFHAQDCAERDLSAADLPPALGPDVEAIALGSYVLAVEPIGSALLALAEREGARRVVSLDPNLRPVLAGDLTRWRARFDRFVATAAIVKLSEEDLEAAYGAGADPAAHAARWRAAGVGLVVLTRGGAGATAFHACGTFEEAGRPVAVADTVGAGDTFHAALLARLRHHGRLTREGIAALDADTLRDVLRYAGAAAAITCTRRGADLPRAAEVAAALG